MTSGTKSVEGVVEETLPKGLFKVRLDSGVTIRATLSIQAKRVTVRLLFGDRVKVQISDRDPSRGRITQQL